MYNSVMEVNKALIDEIVRRVTEVTPAERIILFGSAAAAGMTRDSDIDILVLQRDIDDPWGERLRVREALRDMPFPFDIVLMTEQRFEETKDVVGGIAYPANKRGKVIYEAA
jgi:predicted nucleotidyltransferase